MTLPAPDARNRLHRPSRYLDAAKQDAPAYLLPLPTQPSRSHRWTPLDANSLQRDQCDLILEAHLDIHNLQALIPVVKVPLA